MASSPLARPGRRSPRRRVTEAPAQTRDAVLVAAAGLGLLVSAYLTIVELAGAATLCLAGSDCDVVRASAYGRVVGLPVAAFGVVYFLTVLGLAIPSAVTTSVSWRQPLLQTLAGVGVGAAVLFVALQAFVIRAWCPYCLVADLAALVVGVRVRLPRHPGRSAERLTRGVVGAALAVTVLIAGYAAAPSSTASTAQTALSPDQLSALAAHLRQSGAAFYGAYWCPHCQVQKQMFGASATQLPYVECDPSGADARPDLCQAAGVRAYPTWVIGGQKLEGEVSPAELARLSGFGG